MARRNSTHDFLQTLAIPTVSLEAHQAQLKQALLASSRPTENNLKYTWRTLMRKKKFVVPGLVAAMAAVVLMVGVVVQTQRPVSAAALTQQSISKVAALDPAERKALDSQLNGDAQSELQAAKKAKDLKVLSYEEYKKHAPQGPSGPGQLPLGDRSDAPDVSKLRYLVYTSTDGTHHAIGIDDNDLPIFIMAYRNNSDGSQQGSVMVQKDNGQSGTMSSGTPPEASIKGSTQCKMTQGSNNPVCTTDSNAAAPTCHTEANGSTTCTSSGGDNAQQ